VRRRTPAGAASFRYGYREVKKKLPNGRIAWERVPLTLEDVLHPEFGDVHVLSDPHADDRMYLRIVLKDRYAGDPSVVVLSDCGIFWDIPRLRHHSPDLAVIFGVKRRKDWKTFHVKTEKVRPALIIEVTSPNTRVNDVKTKVKQYARAQVPHYVIADARESGGKRRLTLIAYRLEGKVYRRVALDEQGRADLEPVGLKLGIRVDPETGGDRLVLIDPATGAEIGVYTAVSRDRAGAETRGRVAEAREAVLRLGRKKLGQPDERIAQEIASMNDLDRLNGLLERILDVTHWDELLPPA
jgi:Uma2 family endonuclease